jgi:hypothetical protein
MDRTEMMHGIYKGPLWDLIGKGALLMNTDPAGKLCEDSIFAQFDDKKARLGTAMLGFGWYEFPKQDFRIDRWEEDGQRTEKSSDCGTDEEIITSTESST